MDEWKEWLSNLLHIWSFELWKIDGHPMTVGKIIVGVALLILSHIACRRLARSIDERFFSRFDIEPSLRYVLHRVLFYFLMAVAVLFVLRSIDVPITIFTVVGGALAIGFGFGSQNIVNNFISGLILMIERPVRVGDIVEVEGIKGEIEMIGIRSTHILTAENRQVILPNSFFLEKAVINSTLGNDIVRTTVAVGVAYGSNPERVREIMLQTAKAQSAILSDPAPQILFADFGDNALVFKLNFWTAIKRPPFAVEVESDVRFELLSAFTKAGIVLPYPQRDVHLHVAKPLPVEIRQ